MYSTSIQTEKNRFREYLPIIGFMISFFMIMGIAAGLLENNIIQWPFRRRDNILETYLNVVTYLPVLFFAVSSLSWLKLSGISVLEALLWKKISRTFWLALLLSIGYSFYLYVTCRFNLKGWPYWMPVILLSLFNAISEELLYRQVFMGLLKKITGRPLLVNLIQSLFYGAVHIPIGGITFGVYAFLYGLLLGWVMERNRSVIPCIISHFCIDIGNIGLPILVLIPLA